MNYQRRIQAIQAHLVRGYFSALIITSWENLWYLTGIEHLYRQTRNPNQFVLIIPAKGELLLIPTYGFSKSVSEDYPHISKILPYTENREFPPHKTKWERVAEAISEFGLSGHPLGVEMASLTTPNYLEMKKVLANECVPADFILRQVRAVKDEQELERIRQAARLTDTIMDQVIAEALVTGVTERELAHRLRRRALDYNAEAAFTQILSGHRTSYFQNVESSDRRIQAHEIVLVDFGVTFRGYPTDVTRTYCLGEPGGQALETCQSVVHALQEGIAHLVPGRRTGEVADQIRTTLATYGLGDRLAHGVGHGLGINVSEWPPLAEGDETRIERHMVFAVEPGIYEADFGIRIEETVIVQDFGPEILTRTPREIIIV